MLAPPLAEEVVIALVFKRLVLETESEPNAVLPIIPLNIVLPVTLKL